MQLRNFGRLPTRLDKNSLGFCIRHARYVSCQHKERNSANRQLLTSSSSDSSNRFPYSSPCSAAAAACLLFSTALATWAASPCCTACITGDKCNCGLVRRMHGRGRLQGVRSACHTNNALMLGTSQAKSVPETPPKPCAARRPAKPSRHLLHSGLRLPPLLHLLQLLRVPPRLLLHLPLGCLLAGQLVLCCQLALALRQRGNRVEALEWRRSLQDGRNPLASTHTWQGSRVGPARQDAAGSAHPRRLGLHGGHLLPQGGLFRLAASRIQITLREPARQHGCGRPKRAARTTVPDLAFKLCSWSLMPCDSPPASCWS